MASRRKTNAWTRTIRALLLALACVILALVWWGVRHSSRQAEPPAQMPSPTPIDSANATRDATPSPALSPATPFATPSPLPASTPQPSSQSNSVEGKQLLIPVAGVRPEALQDTFTDARSEGRVHDALDIPAARNTPVLAAADGTIVKLFQSVRGGTTIYQLDPDNRTVYYYAHLDHYAENLTEGRVVRRGELIAYVGDTGNAVPGNYHLHFSISLINDPKHFYDGTNINPYPLLRRAAP
ncbi:MAG: peptidoglycan DD-metalloendopeptidase family protein [Pyrinomonadaceae bacterium]